LAEIVAERDPKQIAINVAENFPLADGLSHGMHQQLVAALGPYAERLVSKPALAVGWLETRIPEEMAVYPHVVRLARSIIAEAFSDRVITPGATTADDVRWFMRDRIKALGLSTWFHPSVNIQRSGQDAFSITSMGLASANVIQPGDLLHVDFGITYLGLNTDTQHMAYVLRPGETQAPDGLRAGFAQANRVQDLLMAEFRAGRSGNEVLLAADAACAAEGLRQNIYSHPLGLHGHGAGPWIGGWDTDGAIPGRGDLLVYPNTAWSIELNATASVPEWGGQEVRFMTEEDAFFDGEQIRFMDGRQTELTLIGAPSL
jgi:Xaa-Pro aminopeptidase